MENSLSDLMAEFFARREGGYHRTEMDSNDHDLLLELGKKYELEQPNPDNSVTESFDEDTIQSFLLTEISDEEEDRINFIVAKLTENPELIGRVYRQIRQSDEDFDIESALRASDNKFYESTFKKLVNAINNTPGDYNDVEKFVQGYGKIDYIDTAKLMSGVSKFDDFIIEKNEVSKEFLMSLFLNLFSEVVSIPGSNRGPGELALAVMSPSIEFADIGDLKIDGKFVEVKGEDKTGAGGGRLKNTASDFGVSKHTKSDYDKIYDEIGIPEEGRIYRVVGNWYRTNSNLHLVAKELEKYGEGKGGEFAQKLVDNTYIYSNHPLKKNLGQNILNYDPKETFEVLAKIAYDNYVQVLAGKKFTHFLLLNKENRKSVAFHIDDYEKYLNKHFYFSSLSFNDSVAGPAVKMVTT